MKKGCAFIIAFLLLSISAKAQTTASSKLDSIKAKESSTDQKERFKKNDSAYKVLVVKRQLNQYRVDSSDLKLALCSFEKDANAMVIYDDAVFGFGNQRIMEERFKRIKIFNNNGTSEANIRIEYNNRFGAEHILAVVAHTMNFVNGKIEYTKLDSSLIYNVHTDKQKDAVVFTMPNVKSGSVIEYAYTWTRESSLNFPGWVFQSELPTAHSEVSVILNPQLSFTQLTSINKPFATDTVIFFGRGHKWAMNDMPSSKNEPFMRSASDGVQHISLILTGFTDLYGKTQNFSDSWSTVGKRLFDDKIFTKPFNQRISDADTLIKKAKTFKTNDEKIQYVFNSVKTIMKWNGEKFWLSKDGIKNAWKNRTGNWGEINMVLFNILKQSGIKVYPMLVSTRSNGLLYENFPDIFQVDKLVAYIPVDSNKYYVLDASDKYNLYNEVPYELLNSIGLALDAEGKKSYMVRLKNDVPLRSSIIVNARITPDGSMSGSAEIWGYGYNKSSYLELYKTVDEKDYKKYLTDYDNNITVTSLKIENSEIDSLPLKQNLQFTQNLASTGDEYIYFSPNLFTNFHKNVFLSKTRNTDIDFGFENNLQLVGNFKIPEGYKIDHLPDNIKIASEEKDISLKRVAGEENGIITIYYALNYKKALYQFSEYENLYLYFKKMYELLNEQIVLKKI